MNKTRRFPAGVAHPYRRPPACVQQRRPRFTKTDIGALVFAGLSLAYIAFHVVHAFVWGNLS